MDSAKMRRRTARLSPKSVSTSIAAGIAVAVLSACGSSPTSVTRGASSDQPAASSHKAAYPLPAVGASGFPRSTYPSPRHGGAGSIPACPAPSRLRPFDDTQRARAVVFWATVETRTFTYDLRHTDRAWWSVIQADWRNHKNWSNPDSPLGPGAPHVPVLYAGPLRGMPRAVGVPPQYGYVRHSCGAEVADHSYAVIGGPRRSGALQGVLVFLNRDSHVLLYYEYP
jgi:hypothetical protein